jgi:hypothetical protein
MSWPSTSKSFEAVGMFVFYSADGAHRFVLLETEIVLPPYPMAMGISEM